MQIKIGGKLRGLKFNQTTFELFALNATFEDSSITNSTMMYATFYGALVSNVYAKRQEQDFTFENVVDWVDELDNVGGNEQIFQDVNDKLAELKGYKKWMDKTKEAIEAKQPKEEKKS